MTSPRVILASASPRRQALLRQIGVACQVCPQDIDETRRPDEAPKVYVRRMADEKAEAALGSGADTESAVIVASDTSVVCEGAVLGKPETEAEAVSMLQLLAGREHQVLTAVTVADASHRAQALSESKVLFREIPDAEARRYWQSGEPLGKAGGYAIQGLGAVFVKTLVGSYSGVMGLPLFETARLLAEFGVTCWQADVRDNA